MRILVVSDTHGDLFALRGALREQPGADAVIHLGDGRRDAEAAAEDFPGKRFILLSGNCDFGLRGPEELDVTLGDKRIFCAHGHTLHVKFTLAPLLARAGALGADIALYGHTHVPYTSYENGLYVMNPGSLGHPRDGGPTYGVIDITQAGVVLNVVNLG